MYENTHNSLISSSNDEIGSTWSKELSKKYVVTIKLKYVQVSGKCGANGERDYAGSSDVQSAIKGAEGGDARSRKTIIMDAAIQRNTTRLTR